MRNPAHFRIVKARPSPPPPTPKPRIDAATQRKKRWSSAAAWTLSALALLIVVMLLATQWAENRALNEMAERADASAQLNTVALRSSLEKFRAVPDVLARDSEVRDVLALPDAQAIEALDGKLDELSRSVGASVIYLLNRQGLAIAASNWREPLTFQGMDYRFRPYFTRALHEGQAEYFALGTTSHEAGLYLSRRVEDRAGRPLGVIVLKMEFGQQEADWRALPNPLFVTDEQGIVLIGNVPQWQFRSLAPLPPEQAQTLRNSLQFGEATLAALPLAPSLAHAPPHALTRITTALPTLPAGTLLMHSAMPVPASPRWTLHTLMPVQANVRRVVSNVQLTVLLLMAALYAASAIIYYRRRLSHERVRAQSAAKTRLERRVHIRTRQLRSSNEQLLAQIDERERAETRLHEMQDELVQANKLALLGQVAAGVAHEINQPLSAIRAYADNAGTFLKRGDGSSALKNLRTIAQLTERIGGITGELRAFSRKAAAHIAPLALRDAVGGALLLMSPRLQRQNAVLDYTPPPACLRVWADRMRLEQVLVNLMQNALDATLHAPRLSLRITASEDSVELALTDNGPGIPAHVLEKLFTPFQTTKPEGLGLGLVICRDILTECGGTLAARNGAQGGATFLMRLRRAPDTDSA
ncbi:sensor histidine kinase [Bordetella avium]|uniref:sensor histidine kinase n=1 Tax=Bordetella avium TaxID=521 RepID=UPI001F4D4B3F|nr:ATP-binding protein [Bordetella avium]